MSEKQNSLDARLEKIKAEVREKIIQIAVKNNPRTKPSDYIFRRPPPIIEKALIRHINQTLKRQKRGRKKQ